MKVLIDTSPLSSGHAVRGVGMYTRFLSEALERQKDITVFRSGLEQEVPTVDVVHYPFFDLFFPTLPLLKKHPTVVTIHDVIPLVFPAAYSAGKRGTLALARQKLALKSVAAVITDSEASKKDIMTHLAVPEEKISVIWLAANPFLKPITGTTLRSWRRKLALPSRYIVYVGDINYNKNVPQLIKALKFLPEEIKLVCVGKNFIPQDIPEWQALETQIALSNVAQRVVFRTDILSDEYEQLSAVYSGALCAVQPSLYEGFGLPVLEAMRCKTPVVAARTSSLLEIGGNVVEFAQPEAEALAQAIETVLSLTARQRSARARAAFNWQETFSWEKTAQQTVAVYRKVQ